MVVLTLIMGGGEMQIYLEAHPTPSKNSIRAYGHAQYFSIFGPHSKCIFILRVKSFDGLSFLYI